MLNIAVRTAIVYGVLVLGIRLLGKRELGQMSTVDFVFVLLVANAVQNAMVGPDTTLLGGLVAAAVLLLMNRLIVAAQERSRRLSHALVGNPALLVHDGELIDASLRREHIDREEVLAALREHGIDDLALVKSAVLEVDGTISVIPRNTPSTRTRRRVHHTHRRP